MSPETRAILATAFAVLAIIAALASATATAVYGVRVTHQIQVQRVEAVEANCKDVNERHDNTVKTLDALVAEARQKATPERAKQLKQSIASTTLLIDALTPHRPDCRAYAVSVVQP